MILQWRTFAGLVVHQCRVFSYAEALGRAVDERMQWPTMAPWIVGPKGLEEQLAPPWREWGPLGDVPLSEPGTPRAEAA